MVYIDLFIVLLIVIFFVAGTAKRRQRTAQATGRTIGFFARIIRFSILLLFAVLIWNFWLRDYMAR